MHMQSCSIHLIQLMDLLPMWSTDRRRLGDKGAEEKTPFITKQQGKMVER